MPTIIARPRRPARSVELEAAAARPRGGAPSPGGALAIRHNALRDALAETFGIGSGGVEALGARVKNLLGQGIRRDKTVPGRGRGHRNTLPDALDAALALTLQRAFVPPSAAVAMLVAERDAVTAAWAAAARGRRSTITVEVDALEHAGRDGMRTGRFSEDAAGTVRLAGVGNPAMARGTAAAPRITIDLRALRDAVIANLQRAGVPAADLRRAEADMAEAR